MLRSSLKSIYQKYKADSNSVATWLAETAKAHGFTSNASSSINPPATAGKKKGKARKQAKATGNVMSRSQHVIRIKDFEPMARCISKIDSVRVPDELAVALKRVIWVRKTFSERLTAMEAGINQTSDQRHSSFVGVLEKVHDYLKPRMTSGTFNADISTRSASKGPKDPSENIFDVLNVYASSKSFLNTPDIAVPQSKSDVTYIIEQEDSREEAVFALITLLNDYTLLGEGIKSLWTRYTNGQLDIAAISVATNTAFELARSMEEEVASLFVKNGGAEHMAQEYFSSLSKAAGIDPLDKNHPSDGYNSEAYELARHTLMNTNSIIRGYAAARMAEYIPITSYNGNGGWYDEELGSSGENKHKRLNQDKLALVEILPDIEFLSSNMGRGAKIEDELIRGLRALLMDKELHVPLWLSWAFQVYLDILQSLGADCGRGFAEMRQQSLKIKMAMLDVPKSSQERDGLLRVVLKWDKDPIREARERMVALGVLPSRIPSPFKFLHRNPLHCGLLIHNMRATLHYTGVQYAAIPGAVMCITQLYHALRQEKLLPAEMAWEDLDVFWKMQGNPTFFVGDPPTDREGYYKNHLLTIGVSASDWAKGMPKGKLYVNFANRRYMKFKGWVSSKTNQRLAPTGPRPPLSSECIGMILEDGGQQEGMDGRGHKLPEGKQSVEEALLDSIQLTPVEVITKLALKIDAEVPEITFNYFTMHGAAWDLLEKLTEEFTRMLGADSLKYVLQEGQLPSVVGYVLLTAAGQRVRGSDDKARPMDNLMHAAAKVMRKFLEEGHGRVVQEGAKAEVKPEELADADFRDSDPWVMDKMIRKTKRDMARQPARRGGAGCPVQ